MKDNFEFLKNLSPVKLMELKEELCKQLVETCCTNGSNAKIIKEE